MYQVYCDGQPIHDLRSEELVLNDPTVTLEDNDSGSFEFTINPNHPMYDGIKKLKSVIQVLHNGVEIFCGRPTEEEKDFYKNKKIYCKGELSYLSDSIQRPAEYHNMTVRGFLETLVNIHNAQTIESNVAITFNSQCAGESSNYDYLYLYYVQNGTVYRVLNKVRANSLAGKTIVVPTLDFYVYWHTDKSVNTYYGFSIDGVKLTDAACNSATAISALPSYTATETSDISDVQTAHSPYDNNSNLFWHYTYTVPDDYVGTKSFKVGMVTVTDSNDSLYRYTNYEDTLTCIKDKLVKSLGGHLQIRKVDGIRYLDYLEDYPNTNDQTIEFGKNLLDFSQTIDASDIATAVIPLGGKLEESTIEALDERLTIKSVNNDCDFIFSQDAVDAYGWIFRTVEFDDVNVPSNLKRKGQEYLSEIQFEPLVLDVTAVDLNNLNVDMTRINLLDMVRVVSKPHGLDKFFPVTKLTLNLEKPESDRITLGSETRTTMSSINTSANTEIMERINNIPSESSILKQAKDNATALITAATHGHVVTTAEEQLIMDTDDVETAQKVWRWNLNGLGYSSTGYNGKYGTAITMDGQIVGERLVGGSVSAEKLDVSYKTSVEKKITDAQENAEVYADDQLKSYWTRTEVETAIKNTGDAVLLFANEKAIAYTDNKLKNYSTSAQIKVTTDAITSEVNKKLNSSELSTKIQQNSNAVSIAWNNISKYIQFESGELRIYDSAIEGAQKIVSKFNHNGCHFYRDDYYVGKIGTNKIQNDPSKKGLSFDLEYNSAYMSWASKDSSSEDTYTMKWTYVNKGWGNYEAGELHAGCNINMHGWTLKNVSFEGGGVTGTMNFIQVLGVNSDGKITNWSSNCELQFKNGILISGTWYS